MPITEGSQLKKFLAKEGLTQSQFADDIGASQSLISKYIRGDLAIPFSVLKYLRKKYQMNYEWFFENTGPMKLKGLEDRKTLISDVTNLRDTVELLENKLQSLDGNFKRLHAEFHHFKSTKN